MRSGDIFGDGGDVRGDVSGRGGRWEGHTGHGGRRFWGDVYRGWGDIIETHWDYRVIRGGAPFNSRLSLSLGVPNFAVDHDLLCFRGQRCARLAAERAIHSFSTLLGKNRPWMYED